MVLVAGDRSGAGNFRPVQDEVSKVVEQTGTGKEKKHSAGNGVRMNDCSKEFDFLLWQG